MSDAALKKITEQNDRILAQMAENNAATHANNRKIDQVLGRIDNVDERLADGASRFSEVLGRLSRLERRQQNGLTGVRVLIVEDDAHWADVAERFLEECGAQCSVATTVEGAHKVLGVRQRDVAIIDARLPDGCGVDLCRALRSSHPGLRLVLTSGDPDELAPDRADVCLEKPIRLEELRETVMRLAVVVAPTDPPPPDPIDREAPTLPGVRTSPPPSTADESPQAKQKT